MTKVTGGEAIVQSLIQHGVDTIFGLPGVQNDWLYNALYDARDKIRVIHSRHEQGVAYMALGYALSSNRVGVYSVVPGPGLLNTTAALATAYSHNARVLCLAGQIRSDQIGRGFGMLHEIPDQLGTIRSLTKWAARVESPTDAPELVAEAFRQLYAGRPRPVGLEVPLDVLAHKMEVDLRPIEHDIRFPLVDVDAIDEAAKLLGQAENPLIFVGSGANDAVDALLALAEALQAPVVSTRSGHGVVSSHHYLSHRMTAGRYLWERADVVLAVGTRLQLPRLSSFGRDWGENPARKIIHIDIDPAELTRFGRPAVGILARSQDALPELIQRLGKYNRKRPSRQAEMEALKERIRNHIAPIQPQVDFLNVLRAELPDDGFFVNDFTQVGYMARYTMDTYQPRTFLDPGYQGTLGWSFATALGVKVANPDRAVLTCCGDGGFLFTMPELATAVQHGINTVTVIFNDGAYGNVKRMQKLDYGGRTIASDLQNPDFVKVAEAFNALGLRAHTPEELRAAIRQGFAANVPTLIDVPVDEMPTPWPRVFALDSQ